MPLEDTPPVERPPKIIPAGVGFTRNQPPSNQAQIGQGSLDLSAKRKKPAQQ